MSSWVAASDTWGVHTFKFTYTPRPHPLHRTKKLSIWESRSAFFYSLCSLHPPFILVDRTMFATPWARCILLLSLSITQASVFGLRSKKTQWKLTKTYLSHFLTYTCIYGSRESCHRTRQFIQDQVWLPSLRTLSHAYRYSYKPDSPSSVTKDLK